MVLKHERFEWEDTSTPSHLHFNATILLPFRTEVPYFIHVIDSREGRSASYFMVRVSRNESSAISIHFSLCIERKRIFDVSFKDIIFVYSLFSLTSPKKHFVSSYVKMRRLIKSVFLSAVGAGHLNGTSEVSIHNILMHPRADCPVLLIAP